MNRNIIYLILPVFISIAVAGCQQFEDRTNNIPIVKTLEADEITATTATIHGEIESLNAIYCFYYFLISEDSSFPEDGCLKFFLEEYEPEESTLLKARLDELMPETTYYYVMCATDGVAEIRGDIMSFTTKTERLARVGDYYYGDGTWSSTLSDTKEPIGVVFALSEEKYGAINPWLEESNHGRIAFMGDLAVWCDDHFEVAFPWAATMDVDLPIPNFSLLDGEHSYGELPYNGEPTNETLPYGMWEWPYATGEQYALNDYNGYSNSYGRLVGVSFDSAQAIHHAKFNDGYGEIRWYLPALGELARFGMACAAEVIPKECRLNGAYYWSSTECDAATAWVYGVGAGNNHNHIVQRYEKINESMYCKLRPVACF